MTQVKPGNYGLSAAVSPRALTFAPNVTPGTYVEADDDMDDSMPPSPTSSLFPPTEAPSQPTRRRLPPGKRLSQGYIPRPPNAFMLFRANFVRQKHVPGSIETNHGSLSKIIGNIWRGLKLEEKKYWENMAKKAKAAHRERYPNYRFRPVHKKKNKGNLNATDDASAADKRRDRLPPQPEDEERCEVVAQLLLEGKKGAELAEAMRQIEHDRAMGSRPESAEPPFFPAYAQPQLPLYMQRRSSSVPPPSTLYNAANPIALPTLPFLVQPTPQYGAPAFAAGYMHGSRPPSPVNNIARTRTFVGMRRASSVQPIPSERMWDAPLDPHQQYYGGAAFPPAWPLQADPSPLPDVTDASIFQPGWTNSFKDDAPAPPAFDPALGMHGFVAPDAPAPHAHAHQHQHQHPIHVDIGPLDHFSFAAPLADGYAAPSAAGDVYALATPYDAVDPHAPWPPVAGSGPPSTVSGSPARSDSSLPVAQQPVVCAPQPQHVHGADAFGAWVGVELEHDKAQEPALDFEPDGYLAQAQYDMYGMEMEMGVGAPEYGYCASEPVF